MTLTDLEGRIRLASAFCQRQLAQNKRVGKHSTMSTPGFPDSCIGDAMMKYAAQFTTRVATPSPVPTSIASPPAPMPVSRVESAKPQPSKSFDADEPCEDCTQRMLRKD